MTENDKTLLLFAEQQLTGFDHLYKGGDVISLVTAMGLKKEEWLEVKKEMPWLSKRLVEDVDAHFGIDEVAA